MIVILFSLLFFQLNNFLIDNYALVEQNTKKVYNISITEKGNQYILAVESNKLKYYEYYLFSNDTLYMTKRNIRFTIFSKTMEYSPYRIKMIFPLKDSMRFEYNGIEKNIFFNKKIHSITTVKDSNDSFLITTITQRQSINDTSLMIIDKNNRIVYMNFSLPHFSKILQILGYKQSQIIFNYEE